MWRRVGRSAALLASPTRSLVALSFSLPPSLSFSFLLVSLSRTRLALVCFGSPSAVHVVRVWGLLSVRDARHWRRRGEQERVVCVRALLSTHALTHARTPRIMLTAVSKTCMSLVPGSKLLSWMSRYRYVV